MRRLRPLTEKAVMAVFAELCEQPSQKSELSLLFTDDEAIRRINAEWRGSDKPTNVLSFASPNSGGSDVLPASLGDIVLALETVTNEAEVENKHFDHHLSHLIVHGLLHILGYDHQSDEEAQIMESLEIRSLARLAIPDPYGMMIGDD